VISITRRPSFPGEWNHELIWPLAFLGSVAGALGFFYLGLETPGCIFHGLTHLPCLGCGGTRCVRALVHFDFGSAFKFHPAFFALTAFAALWSIYSIIFWLQRDTLRLRFSIKEDQRNKLTLLAIIFVGLHWAWQCYYLSRV
jgi:hypothetical protein